MFQPVEAQPIDLMYGKVEIFNRYDFTRLDRAVEISWELKANDEILQKSDILTPPIPLARLGYSYNTISGSRAQPT